MADKPTHVVIRGGFYRRFGGKLQSLPVGTRVALSEAAAGRLVKNGTVKAIEDQAKKAEPAKAEQPTLAKPETSEPADEPEQEEKPKRKYKKRKAKS